MIKEALEYCWYRICYAISSVKFFFKSSYQTMVRGFPDSETWALDDTFYNWLLKRLIRFRELTNGYPDPYKTFEDWTNELDFRIKQLQTVIKFAYREFLFDDYSCLTPTYIKKNKIGKKVLDNKNVKNSFAYKAYVDDFNQWFALYINKLWW